ncbi:hypothetical protein CFP56_024421 [Quercus suber]|uniref:Uncharacterized protein n=1 Tax=Quercus suber TaxID=58331 RepID=A0AAW0MGI4_QUESU
MTPSEITFQLPTQYSNVPSRLDCMFRLLACHSLLTCPILSNGINYYLVDLPRALSLDLGNMRQFGKGREFGPGPSREWSRCSVSKQHEIGPSKRHVISSMQADSHGLYRK